MKLVISALSLSLLLPSLSAAQQLASNQGAEQREGIIETVVVTGRRSEQNLNQLIGAAGQVSAEQLQLIGHAHINESAARIPGVWLSRGNGQELLAAVRSPVFTGAGSCAEILTTEDGLPTRPTGMCNVNQLFEVNSEQASGLEIWRGPGTVFYGSNAMHGVINSLSPVIQRNYLSLESGSHDYNRVKLGWRQQRGNHTWQIAANGVTDKGFKDDAGFDQQKLSLKHSWSGSELNSDTHLSLVNLNQETAGYIKVKDSYKDSAAWKANPNPEAFRDGQAMRLSSRISGATSAGDQWQITPYVRKSEMTFLQHYLPGQAEEKNGQTSAGIQSSYQTSLATDVSLWLGTDVEWASMWVKEFQANALGVANNVRFQGQHYDFDVDSQQIALFANLEWQLSDQLTTEMGLRYEYLNYDYQNNMLSGTTRDDGSACNSADGSCRYYRPDNRSDSTNNLNFHLGADYSFSNTLSAYTRLASAYRAPQINEIYRLQREQVVSDIKPEELDSIEVGLRYGQDRLAAELNIYSMDKEQVIIKDSSGFVVSNGETSHRGIELQLSYAINPAWQIAAAGNWAKHLYEQNSLINGASINGNDIDTAPRTQGSAQLLFTPSETLSAELEWVYLGDYYLDPANAHQYAGHDVLNLSVQQRYQQWDLRLRVTNLTDERIADRADFGFGSYRYFVGEGRGVLAEVKRYF
ncbi:TonB-dependent receptor [Porticoccaceae bacterium]|nr:TonB-dependent receptor [Porticoccaceae bacterium]